jgi:hypothetical protein
MRPIDAVGDAAPWKLAWMSGKATLIMNKSRETR